MHVIGMILAGIVGYGFLGWILAEDSRRYSPDPARAPKAPRREMSKPKAVLVLFMYFGLPAIFIGWLLLGS
jgi:hypothetical protein